MESNRNHTPRRFNAEGDIRAERGFTLIELLTVIAIISLLMSIALPALGKVRRRMLITRCICNTRQTVGAEIMFACDNNGRFAPTYATILTASNCDPYYPNTLVNHDSWPRKHRNQSEHFRNYLSSPSFLDCPESPGKKPELTKAWKDGDDWNRGSWLMSTKCFWRNFKGLSESGDIVEGPKTMHQWKGGKVLTSCLLNYGRADASKGVPESTDNLMSSTPFPGAHIQCPSVKDNFIWPNFWVRDVPEAELQTVIQSVRIQAGYIDGHVESANASETLGVWIVTDLNFLQGGVVGLLRGKYFLPTGGLR